MLLHIVLQKSYFPEYDSGMIDGYVGVSISLIFANSLEALPPAPRLTLVMSRLPCLMKDVLMQLSLCHGEHFELNLTLDK